MTATAKPPKFAVTEEEFETLLHRYTRDLRELDRKGRFDPVTGRDEELEQMTLILLQRLRKNVLLLGGAGVGKTALFVGLAQWIEQNRVPAMLKDARLIELDMSMIGAGSQNRADLEGRLIPIVKAAAERNAARQGPPILFAVDEFHQLMTGFKGSSYAGIADLLKPYLTAGNLYIIAATTREEYEDYIRIEPALDRRFQKIMLGEPGLATTLSILINIKDNFEQHYGLAISKETCERVVKLTDRYVRGRSNPDKSIIVLDQACARAVKQGVTGALDGASVAAAVASEAGIDARAVK